MASSQVTPVFGRRRCPERRLHPFVAAVPSVIQEMGTRLLPRARCSTQTCIDADLYQGVMRAIS